MSAERQAMRTLSSQPHAHFTGAGDPSPQMLNLKQIEWHGGTSAHFHSRRPSQRTLVEASLVRSAPGRRRWDERTHVEYSDRTR